MGTNSQPIADCTVTLKVGTNGGLQLMRVTDEGGKLSFGNISGEPSEGQRNARLSYPLASRVEHPVRAVMKERGHEI